MKTDIWMPIYCGDYLKDTQDLTITEHGAYFKLMMAYWQKGCLEHCLSKCYRIAGAYTEEHQEAVKNVVDKFFVVVDGSLRNKRLDAELNAANARKDKAHTRAQKAASARWGNATSIPTSNEQAMPKDMLEECPSPSPSPSNINTSSDDDLFNKVIDLYHEILPDLPSVKVMNPTRKAQFKARVKSYPKAKDIEWWVEFFKKASESDFMMGRVKKWRANFDYFLQPNGFSAVIEGKHE